MEFPANHATEHHQHVTLVLMNRSGYLSQEIYGVKRETAGLVGEPIIDRLVRRSHCGGITDSQSLLIIDEVAINDLHRPRNVMDRGVGVS